MADLPLELQPHTVTVRTRLGVTGTGDVFAEPVAMKCWRDDELRLVRRADGQQVVSSTTLYTSDKRSLCTPGSIVQWGDREATVITSAVHDDDNRGGWQHTEVTLT